MSRLPTAAEVAAAKRERRSTNLLPSSTGQVADAGQCSQPVAQTGPPPLPSAWPPLRGAAARMSGESPCNTVLPSSQDLDRWIAAVAEQHGAEALLRALAAAMSPQAAHTEDGSSSKAHARAPPSTPWDVAQRFFKEAMSSSFETRLRHYFVDTSMTPLLVHENYLAVTPALPPGNARARNDLLHLNRLASASEFMAHADVVGSRLVREQQWGLAPLHGALSCVAPGFHMQGSLGRLQFPSPGLQLCLGEGVKAEVEAAKAKAEALGYFGPRRRVVRTSCGQGWQGGRLHGEAQVGEEAGKDAHWLASLDGLCLTEITSMSASLDGVHPGGGSRDMRRPAVATLARTCKPLAAALQPDLEAMRREHIRRVAALDKVTRRLGCQASWERDLARVRRWATCTELEARCVGCRRHMPKAALFLRLNQEGRQRPTCGSCMHRASGLAPVASGAPLHGYPLSRREMCDLELMVGMMEDEGEHVDEWFEVRWSLMVSGYGFQSGWQEAGVELERESPHPPFVDLDAACFADALASGLAARCLFIDLSREADLSDSGFAAIALALPACHHLLYLNLSSTRAGDAGVESLARALTRPADAAGRVPCAMLHWLHLVMPRLGDEGATALAEALNSGAAPGLSILWCCGAFSDGMGEGFRALTSSCDRRRLRLELDHGMPWGA